MNLTQPQRVIIPQPLILDVWVSPVKYTGILPTYPHASHLSRVPVDVLIGELGSDNASLVRCAIQWPTCDLDKITDTFTAKAVIRGINYDIVIDSIIDAKKEYGVTM